MIVLFSMIDNFSQLPPTLPFLLPSYLKCGCTLASAGQKSHRNTWPVFTQKTIKGYRVSQVTPISGLDLFSLATELACFHSITCVIPTDFQNVGVPNLLHRWCRTVILSAEGNVPAPFDKKTHFRHSNALLPNGYDASEGVNTITMSFQ